MKSFLLPVVTFTYLFCSQKLLAQNELLFSQYFRQYSYANPAWVASQSQASISSIFRSQWTGYNTTFDGSGGAPVSQLVSMFIPIKDYQINALSITVTNDQLGPIQNFQIIVPISTSFKLGYGQLYVSFAPAIYTQTIRFDKLRFGNPEDPLNVGTRLSQNQFNLFSGIMYQTPKKITIGLSVTNIFNPNFNFGIQDLNNSIYRTLNIYNGYSLIVNRDLTFNPNLLIRSDFSTASVEANGLFSIKGNSEIGLGFRYGEAAILYLGRNFLSNNRLKIGYALDLVVNETRAKQFTSQEIYLAYSLPDVAIGGKKQIKTPRFAY